MLTLALLILALICFLIGAVNVQPPGTRQINWPSAGLALLVLVYMIRS
jgi:hypothetical protein